jgi:hypothetical protein
MVVDTTAYLALLSGNRSQFLEFFAVEGSETFFWCWYLSVCDSHTSRGTRTATPEYTKTASLSKLMLLVPNYIECSRLKTSMLNVLTELTW